MSTWEEAPESCQEYVKVLKIGWEEMFGSSPESVSTLAQVSRLTILSLQTSLYIPNTEITEFSLCYLITIVSSQDSPLCIFQEPLKRCLSQE